MQKSTAQYQEKNLHILSLPRILQKKNRLSPLFYDSLIWLTFHKFYSLLYIKSFLGEWMRGWRILLETKKLKGHKVNRDSIVIGNGPSQGFLSPEFLINFQKKGDIFVVNFWSENLLLCSVVPDYIVISDDATLSPNAGDHLLEKNKRLLVYLLKHEKIKIICPIRRCKEFFKLFDSTRIIGFVDTELRMWTGNINPLFPRGYLSMTLYKALAISLWFGYKNIYIIGMDNTYPRNIFSDIDNKVLAHEIHVTGQEFVVDQTEFFGNIGYALMDSAKLFLDLYKFPANNIRNLDEYSLTDAFRKIKQSDWEENVIKN